MPPGTSSESQSSLAVARRVAVPVAGLLALSLLPVWQPSARAQEAAPDAPGSVVVTTELLGAVVGDLVGPAGEVTVLMPSGANPHTFEPSARDAERILGADLLVSNGLDLEEGVLDLLVAAAEDGVPWFEATDHISVVTSVAELVPAEQVNENVDGDHADDHGHGLTDPHFWTDPLAMRDVVVALEPVLAEAGFEVTGAGTVAAGLEALDAEITAILSAVPEERRKLVTGHLSLGWFAERYGFEQVGTVIPGLSTGGEPSARELAELIAAIEQTGVPAVFTEVGTPASVAQAVADDSGATLVPLRTSELPQDGTYAGFLRDLATTVAEALGA